MHKFKIEIQLENKDYCNGCPLVIIDPRVTSDHYFEPCCYLYDFKPLTDDYIRPDICKESEGK